MRGIALTIFLSFWLIFAVLIAAFAVLPNKRSSMHFADHLHQHGLVAAGLFEREGKEACDAYMAVLAERGRMAMSLVDASGQLVCGDAAATHATRRVVTDGAGASFTAAGTALDGFRDLRLRPSFPYTAVVLAILVSGIVCFLVARSLARPIRDVRDASHRLAAGDLQARASAATSVRHDEIGDLGRDFNAMAGRIEALVTAQNQLLSDISHELRSPLARLHVALELARRKAGSAAETDLARIETEADRMNDLIGRVLSLARAEHDETAEAAARLDLAALVRDVAADADFEASQQDKAVDVVVSAHPTVNGRATLIASAVDNVLRNAVRHTPAGTRVQVAIDEADDAATISIRDHGPGVPATDIERIFTPFHRVGIDRSQSSGGVGLGLAIARRAIALHEGTIAAENAAGGGLRVTIRLPR